MNTVMKFDSYNFYVFSLLVEQLLALQEERCSMSECMSDSDSSQFSQI